MIALIQDEVKKQQWIKVENEFIYMDEVVVMNKKGRDADNLKKLTQDSITESGVVWTDDTYCLARTQRIYIDPNSPRIELTISVANHKGIYNNIDEYNNFISTYCNNCYKNKDKCVLLRESLESRINENIIYNDDCFKCLKFKKSKR